MSDIAGIRLIEDLEYADPYEHPEDCVVLLEKAAAEITALRAELEMAREALQEIAELRSPLADASPSDYARGWMDGRYRAVGIARAALEVAKKERK